MCESMIRTICLCLIFLGAFYASSYVADLNDRVTALEERVDNSVVIPLPINIELDRRFKPGFTEGEWK